MSATATDTAPSQPRRYRGVFLAVLSLAIVAAVRGWLQFSTDWVPGMNGGYYLVQARALLERGALGIPDLPLTFMIHAAVAKLLHLVPGMDLQRSILLAVKCCDSLLPAFLVLPIAAIVRGYSSVQSCMTRCLPWVTGLAVALSPTLLSMVGDFEKQSLGLVWLACFAWRLHKWMLVPHRRNGWLVLLCLALVSLTHISVFGAGLILTAATLVPFAILRRRSSVAHSSPRVSLWFYLGAAAVIMLAGALVFWWFDHARVARLWNALTSPLEFLGGGENHGRGGMQGGPGMRSPGAGPMGPGGMGGPGFGPPGMGGVGVMRYAPTVLFVLISLGSLFAAWRKRLSITTAELASICGLALTLLALTGPWVQGDKAMRLQMVAMVPAGLCAAYLIAALPVAWLRGLLACLALGLTIYSSVPRVRAGGRPVLAPAAMRELESLAASVEEPEATLISAQHGVEWWTAWYLHTRISQGRALTPDDWQKYKYVWFIEVSNAFQPPMMPGGPSIMRADAPRQNFERRDYDQPGPRDASDAPFATTFFPGMPPEPPTNNSGPRGQRGRGMGGPMGATPIPEDAEILFNGEFIKLAWVKTPPASVR